MSTAFSDRPLFRRELRLGLVSEVSASAVRVNLDSAGAPSGSLFEGGRYGLGEVGEFVVIESELVGLLGRILDVRLPERERGAVGEDAGLGTQVSAFARVQLLGSISLEDLHVSAGVEAYPRLGDRVYAAPGDFVAQLPERMAARHEETPVTLRLGTVRHSTSAEVVITPERLFGRHCAVLGATGGGKSYTVARLIEECLRFNSKLILLDATGEYRGLSAHATHCSLGRPQNEPENVPEGTQVCSFPASCFTEADFFALFEPAPRVQAPKLRAAIQTLRLLALNLLEPDPPGSGTYRKANRSKVDYENLLRDSSGAWLANNPTMPFNPTRLTAQILEECVFESPQGNASAKTWGGVNETERGNCSSLLLRISQVLTSPAFAPVFEDTEGPSLTDKIDEFFTTEARLLRISLEAIQFEFHAREIIANALGRHLLGLARAGKFRRKPVLLFVDEAHHFLGRTLGDEDNRWRLDAFELIAKEGRKYGLNLCLATQRPRDITEDVLSQMGTLIVHRLTNDRDREVVERACGEIDRSASAFLPNLEPGQAAIVGVDLPIPLTIQITKPAAEPQSSGAAFQEAWNLPKAGKSTESGGPSREASLASVGEP